MPKEHIEKEARAVGRIVGGVKLLGCVPERRSDPFSKGPGTRRGGAGQSTQRGEGAGQSGQVGGAMPLTSTHSAPTRGLGSRRHLSEEGATRDAQSLSVILLSFRYSLGSSGSVTNDSLKRMSLVWLTGSEVSVYSSGPHWFQVHGEAEHPCSRGGSPQGGQQQTGRKGLVTR